jgi:hypothetical protein
MKISLTQSGGWANVRFGCSLETGDLPSEDARVVEEIIRGGGLVESRASPSSGADLLRYELTVETPDGKKTMTFDDRSKSHDARKVLELLRPSFRPLPALRRVG